MTANYDEILNAALSLPPGARAMLAQHLLESLSAEDQKRLDAIWADEAKRRMAEMQEGRVEPIDGESLMQELRTRER
jgi:putative addiction module component (TIGR02574 family)